MKNELILSRLSIRLLRSPARLSILGFALLIAVGTALLMLPASATGSPMGLVDALFMSTSASCVTGLSVLDIGRQLTLFGQLVILLLIQLGGLGILTISTLLLMMMKGRPTLSGQAIIKDTFTYGEGKQTVARGSQGDLHHRFFHRGCRCPVPLPEDGSGRGLGPGRLPGRIPCRQRLLQRRLLPLPGQLRRLSGRLDRQWRVERADHHRRHRFCGHRRCEKAVYRQENQVETPEPAQPHGPSASAIFILLGTLAILFMEWNNTLSTLSIPGRLLAALFQSISSRTAGFNTLDMGIMANETLFMLCILMFIGACPGSCGGGVKTTTVAGLAVVGHLTVEGIQPAPGISAHPDRCQHVQGHQRGHDQRGNHHPGRHGADDQ
jgi:trk system potassium uptake protein TrkH